MADDVASPDWSHEGTHLKVGVLADSRVVVVERSALSTGDADLAAIFGPVEPALHGIPRERYGLLIDVRAARGRNDSRRRRISDVPHAPRVGHSRHSASLGLALTL